MNVFYVLITIVTIQSPSLFIKFTEVSSLLNFRSPSMEPIYSQLQFYQSVWWGVYFSWSIAEC
jgi:hypothetical protein